MWAVLKQVIETAMFIIPSKHTEPWIKRKCKRLSRRKRGAYNWAKKNMVDDWDNFKRLTIRRSCESQLVLTIHGLAKSLNDGHQIDSVLLDFSNALIELITSNSVLSLIIMEYKEPP